MFTEFRSTAPTLLISLAVLALQCDAHPSPNHPPPKWSMQGHNRGHLYGMIKEDSVGNPVLKETLRTDISKPELDAALEFHNRAVSQHLARIEMGDMGIDPADIDRAAPGGAAEMDMNMADDSTMAEDIVDPTAGLGSDATIDEMDTAEDGAENIDGDETDQGRTEAASDSGEGEREDNEGDFQGEAGSSKNKGEKSEKSEYYMEIKSTGPYGAKDIRTELAAAAAKEAANKKSNADEI